jgi:hypothetical protein
MKRLFALIFTCLFIQSCSSDNPLKSNTIDGVFNLESMVFVSDVGQTITLTSPSATGRISFEPSGSYAYQFSFDGSVVSDSGTYTLSGGIVIIDNQTSGIIDGSTVNSSISYTGSKVIMIFTFSPPADGLVSYTITFGK